MARMVEPSRRRSLARRLFCATLVLLVSSCVPSPAPTAGPAPSGVPAATPSPTASPARFEKAACEFPKFSGMGKIECGYLSVPEDRSQPNSSSIKLHVAIVRSSSPQPAPDPVVYLHGGFGGEALSMLQYQLPLFREVFADHDVIVFDQRGGGFSRPSLNCPEVEDQLYQDFTQNLSREEAQQHYAQAAQACHDRLVGEGVNLAAYTSAANAADVNDLRVALGYAEWNLYGVSYGTRLALTVMRDFPVGVRSAILDSVYPPQVDIDAELAGNAERAFDLLFDRCAADAGCNAAYPDLKTVFYDTVAQLDANPRTVHLTRPKTGQSYAMVVNGDRLVRAVFQMLYSTDTLPSLPKMIYELHAGRADTFRQYPIRIAFSADYVSEGVGFSVKCSEETSFSSPQVVATANAAVPPRLRDASDDTLLFTVCAGWGARPAPAIENQPVASAIPTLILAGDSDPITPPRWGRAAAETLSKSYTFEFPGVGHGVLGAGPWGSCSEGMASAFLADPGSAPDSTCLSGSGVFFVTIGTWPVALRRLEVC